MSSAVLSKSPQKLLKKTYDYLVESQQKSQLPRSSQKPQMSPYSKEQAEYQLIVQFQLRREKEKNIILEERLKNKESFIKQMKEFQDQLTVAFQRCQEDLQYYKAQCLEYEGKFESFATFNNGNASLPNINSSLAGNLMNLSAVQQITHTNQVNQQLVRQYVEEIAELKHLVIRLEEQINYYEKKEKLNAQSKFMSSSVKHQFYPVREDSFRQVDSRKKIDQESPAKGKKVYKQLQQQKKQQRSKTLANEFVNQKRQEDFSTLSKISQFIQHQTRKVSSFISHFLTMCEFFEQSLGKEEAVKHRLKKAWKWIKSTIAQWNYLKREKIQKVREYKIGNIVASMLPLSGMSIEQIQILLDKLLRPTTPQYKNSKNQ